MFSEKNHNTQREQLRPWIEAVRTGRFDAAIDGLKTFLSTFPEDEVATGLLAASYFQIGMPERAQPLYERVLMLNPLNALARFQLGMTHYSQRSMRAALEAWEPLLETQQEFMARFHSALAHLQLGESEIARTLLEQAAKHMPVGHPLAGELRTLRAKLGVTQAAALSTRA